MEDLTKSKTFFEENISEVLDNLDSFESDLLKFDEIISNNTDLSFVHILFRTAHSLKGILSLISIPNSSKLIHSIENVLDLMRSGKIKPSKEINDKFLFSLDLIRNEILKNEVPQKDVDDLINQIIFFKEEEKSCEQIIPNLKLSIEGINLLKESKTKNLNVFLIEKLITTNIEKTQFENLPIYTDIKQIGKIIDYSPKYENIPKNKNEEVLKIVFSTNLDEKELENYIFDPYKKVKISQYIEEIEKNQIKFLIIEDEYISLRLMQEILLNYGYCDTAMNGKDAIGKFSLAHNIGKPYDVILLDIMLPDMDGYQILSHIRKIEEEKNILFSDGVKVIVTSALDDVKSIQKAFREQCEFYLVKPINQAKLESIFKKINLI